MLSRENLTGLSVDARSDVIGLLRAVADSDSDLRHTNVFLNACRAMGYRMDVSQGRIGATLVPLYNLHKIRMSWSDGGDAWRWTGEYWQRWPELDRAKAAST